jgi:plastocyanin
VVHRRVSWLVRVLPLLAAGALLVPAAASAENRRISISNYAWSDQDFTIDRGEHVSWYWIGPDTMHSITGDSPDAKGIDSDPQTNQPQHKIGDTFRVDFDNPGIYSFRCKLHSTVNGTVTVSSTPGDPITEPDPIPRSKVDLEAPNLRDLRLGSTTVRRKGTSMKYSINERARIEIEYLRSKRRGGRQFAGYARYKGGHIGANGLRFGIRRTNFPARPGRYLAKVRAIDKAANATRPFKLRFRIVRAKNRA